MKPRIHAVTLGVADLPSPFRFYQAGLVFPAKMNPGGGIVLFGTKGSYFADPGGYLGELLDSDQLKFDSDVAVVE